MGRLLLALALTTGLVPVTALPVRAGAIEQVAPAPGLPAAYPGSAPAELRTWVQLVWNPVARQLERVRLSAWDPVPSLALDLRWQPDDPAAFVSGLIAGRGTLSFRRPGAAAYDPSGTVAQYRGTLSAGRAEGIGEFLDSDGFAYSGDWRAGLMHGQGRLTLANGDEYVGGFAAGKRQGQGIFTDATGAIYDGRFDAGQREGQGVVMPSSGDAYTADFAGGMEVPGTRRLLPVGELPFPRLMKAGDEQVEGLRIGVVTERRPHNYELGIDPLSYTSKSDGQTLDILPDDQRLLDVWHGNAPITMTDAEVDAYDDVSTSPSFLGAYERFDPVSVVFELENSSPDTVSVVGGFLQVADSVRDREPAMQIRPVPRDPCAGIVSFQPRFYVDNFGWTSADNASLNFTAGSTDGRSQGTAMSVPLGQVAETSLADVTVGLANLGLDTELLSSTKLTCTDPADDRLCLAELRQSGHFGQLADFISLDYSTVEIAVTGTLDYDWAASDGTVAHKSSPFSVVIPIATVANDAECGEGGEIIPLSRDPFVLHLDDSNYRLALPFSGDVTPGFTARWRIELSAPETSEHDFQIVLLLADGRQIASRPIHLTYFMPPQRQRTE